MLIFPNCKINIGLHVVSKRTDNYHDLETVFYPLPLNDALEAIESSALAFNSTGLSIDAAAKDNLCMKAYELIKKDFPKLPAVHIHLHKAIPMGAGLGGGSADGAFMLKLLNKKFELNLSQQELLQYALLLGSDCPFFIINKPCFATGRGEILTPVNLDLDAYKIILVNPGIHISTKEAFAKLTFTRQPKSIQQIFKQDVSTWKNELINDFEKPVFQLYPEIENIKDTLYHAGAIYSSMTGSGSTVFGIFPLNATPNFYFPKHYLVITLP